MDITTNLFAGDSKENPIENNAMIRSVLIDDEPKNIRILRGLLEEFCPSVKVVAEANGAQDAIPLIREHQPDLLFLDIEMPFGNAFDLLDKLKPVDFEIIFITAFDEYTLKAFKYSALDYLLKPVNIDELKEAVQKAGKRIEHKNINKQLTNLFHNIKKPPTALQRIAFPDNEGVMVFIELKEISHLEAKRGYTYVYTRNKQVYISSRIIKEYEELLPEDLFFRVHNSSIINMSFIRKYHKGRGGIVEMEDGSMLEVAARRKDEFLSRFAIE
jgi:two-component system LytT family response regulator